MKLRALNYPNIISFDDKDSGTGHWLPTTTEGISDDPEGQCELYIMRPPLPVSVAAATAQYLFSIMDAHIIIIIIPLTCCISQRLCNTLQKPVD